MLGPADEIVTLKKVQDGDTLLLRDGRRVRLIGVNAPELARDGRPAQPLALESRQFVERFLGRGELKLVYDRDRHDRYGRLLAHVHNSRGDSLEAALLSAGLAFHVAIAPNLSLAECLAQRQAQARRAGRGLWAEGVWPVLQARDVRPGDGGFVRLRGRVLAVERNRFVWLELDGPVAVRLRQAPREFNHTQDHTENYKQDQDRDPDPDAESGQPPRRHWLNREIEVKGWLVDRGAKYASRHPQNKRWFIAIDSEFTIEISRN
ncbi:thermonuclease family protein [Microbulbifer aestuariivivens]|uniref:thermonuclease family protein n=1 Tax=Microbulbifer aestuariivivens TaxID=1908308 RepID=UPI0031EAF9FE